MQAIFGILRAQSAPGAVPLRVTIGGDVRPSRPRDTAVRLRALLHPVGTQIGIEADPEIDLETDSGTGPESDRPTEQDSDRALLLVRDLLGGSRA